MTHKRESVSMYLDSEADDWFKPPRFRVLSDFDAADMDQLRVEFMRISPSYSYIGAAHQKGKAKPTFEGFADLYSRNIETIKHRGLLKAKSSKLTQADSKHLAKVFESVLNTYREYKDIHRPYFDWYTEIGRYVFDNYTNRQDVKLVGISKHDDDPMDLSRPEVMRDAKNYLEKIVSDRGSPKTLVLAIPMDLPKKTALKHTKILIDSYYDWVVEVKDTDYRKRKMLATKRERPDALAKKLKLLVCKAFHPELTLWQLGEMAGVSDAYRYKKLDQTQNRPSESLMRTELASLTNRALRTAQYIAEHAATDQFPVQKKVLTPYYDWEEVKSNILKAHPHLNV